jgi:ABC-type branched-subunit amino acid transport system permease subunit
MLMRLGRGFLWAVGAYLAGAVLTYALTLWLSSNVHDREVEALMTGAFVGGPLCALLGFIAGVARRSRSAD